MQRRKQVCAIAKRLADVFEKFAVASFALGAYQGHISAGVIGLAFLVMSLILTWRGAR